MALYLSHHRTLNIDASFDSSVSRYEVCIKAVLQPSDSFGVGCGARTTYDIATGPSFMRNPVNNETLTFRDEGLIPLVRFSIVSGDWRVTIEGNALQIEGKVVGYEMLLEAIGRISEELPRLLSVFLRVHHEYTAFNGTINGCEFGLEHTTWRFPKRIVSAEAQIGGISDAVMALVSFVDIPLQLRTALSYFNHAATLFDERYGSLKYGSEIMLNLAKAVQVLFKDDRDGVIEIGEKLGLAKDDLENLRLLLIARAYFDSAHPRMSFLNVEESDLISWLIRRAHGSTAKLLQALVKRCQSGEDLFILTEPSGKKDKNWEIFFQNIRSARESQGDFEIQAQDARRVSPDIT